MGAILERDKKLSPWMDVREFIEDYPLVGWKRFHVFEEDCHKLYGIHEKMGCFVSMDIFFVGASWCSEYGVN